MTATRDVPSATRALLASYTRYAALIPTGGDSLDQARHAFAYALRSAPPYARDLVFTLALERLATLDALDKLTSRPRRHAS